MGMALDLELLHDDASVPTPSSAGPELPAPAEPVPLAVGHAEDPAEHDADRRADAALARLRRLSGPDGDQLRRTPSRSAGDAVVGREGGAVPEDGAASIERLRGAGSPLPADTRSRMETAFGASFAGVRLHVGAEPSRLNRLVSAHAFTVGRDVFVGQQGFDPGSPGGERVLAHELAHTLQPAAPAVHRIFDKEGELGSLAQYAKDTTAAKPKELNDPRFEGLAWLGTKGVSLSKDEYRILTESPTPIKTIDQVHEELRNLRLPHGSGMEGMTRERLTEILPSYGVDKVADITKVADYVEKQLAGGKKVLSIIAAITSALTPGIPGVKAAKDMKAKMMVDLTAEKPEPAEAAVEETFVRGDTRPKKLVEDAGGLFGWQPVTVGHARNMAQQLFEDKTAEKRCAWFREWKAQTKGASDAPPYVAFGRVAQKGGNNYTAKVKLIWEGNPSGAQDVAIATDTGDIATANHVVVAFQDEFLFLTGVPKKFITGWPA